jgi:uncharacterized membrane protein
MANPFQIKINASRIETPLATRHVESHLIFGPLARHLPLAYVLLAIGVLSLILGFFWHWS